MDELRDKRKKEEGHMEAEAQGEGERKKLNGKAKLLLAEHKEMKGEVGVESELILKDHELQANPSHSSSPHSIFFLFQDPRGALSMDTLVGSPNILKGVSVAGKEDLSCGHQVDHIDDRIDSSSKIDLFPPSVDTYALNASSLFCNNCVDQPVCECSSLVDGSYNVIKKPQVGGTNEDVDHLIRIDSLSMSFVADPIACFAHRDPVLEDASKYDMCLFEDDEITPSDVPSGVNLESSIVLDSYTCYSNPLWCEAFPPKDGNLFLKDESTLVGKEGDEEECGVCFPITSSSWCVSLLNGMNNAFEPIRSHTYVNSLEEVDLRDIFLYYLFTYDDVHAVEWSMLLGGTSDHLINGGALDPSSWKTFPFDPGSELSCGIYVAMHGQNGRHKVGDIVNSFPYAEKLFLRFCHPLEELGKDSFLDLFSISYPKHDLVECAPHGGRRYLPREGKVCTFLYYLFAYDEIPSWIRSALHVDQGILKVYTCWYDPVLWTFYHFDLGECMKVFERVEISSFRWYYHVVEKNNHCPCSPSVGLIAMTIEDVWLFLEFESPWLNVLSANLCTNHHTKRMLVIYVILQGLDSRTQFYLLDIKEALCLMGCETNEGLHINLFKCIGSSALPFCQCVLLSQVSITLMGFKPFVATCDAWLYVKFVHPWHGDEIVIANANPHAIRIFVLFPSPMVLQGTDSRTNPFQQGENDAIQIAPKLFIHEFQRIDGSF
ncbi:hypothetical protein KY285_010314 [Solanum tuberosum]|nr:hypothetical protein KY289_010859 [Solanum tuberosum]KAH0734607.1 hypothetical protein KY285_010314 [Solanum tuberosum]